MKKFISKVLIFAMLISVLPKTNFASEEKVNTETVNQKETGKNEKAEKNAEKKEKVNKEEKKENVKAEEKEEVKTEKKLEKEENKEKKSSPVKALDLEIKGDPEPEKYNIEYIFKSAAAGKELPQEVLDKKPADLSNVANGSVINLEKFDEVKVAGGTWQFAGWFLKTDEGGVFVGDTFTVSNANACLMGMWTFTQDPEIESYTVQFIFQSITDGKELPEEVLAKKPADLSNVANGTAIPLEKFDDIKVAGGTWKFSYWCYITADGSVTAGDEAHVNGKDLTLAGRWKFEKDPELEKYDVTFTFKSITPGKELADEVKAKTPANKLGVENGTVIFLEKFADVKVIDGTWKFVKWQLATGPSIVDVEDEVTVNGADLNLTGLWKFEPDPEKYNVTFHFVTLTLGKELPAEVLTKKPANQSDVPSGTVIALPKYEDVKVEGGTWKFRYWYLSLGDHGNEVENEITVENADLFLIGGWEFEKDPEPKKYNVEFSFYSVTKGKELPDEIKAKLPANQINVLKGTVITLPTYEDVKVEGGKWIFEGWLLETEFGYIDVKNEVVVNNGNLFLAGPWRFEADKKPAPPKPLKPQKPKVQKGRMLPKTNVESAFSYVILALAGIGGAYITNKKDK